VGVQAEREVVLSASVTPSSVDLSPSSLPLATPGGEDGLSRVDWKSFWIKTGIIAGLFLLAFWPNFRRLWLKTNPISGEANWGHAIAVPLIGIYYLYTNRTELFRLKSTPSWTGLPVLCIGVLTWAYGIWPGRQDVISDFGILVSMVGVVALVCGWGVMRIAWFPIAFLLCAIPWTPLLYSTIAWPLQKLAAEVAIVTLKISGVVAYGNDGTKIFIGDGILAPPRTLNVAEACAGIRSLMTFVTVAAAIGFLMYGHRPLWQRLVITLSAVPIAIVCNVIRIAGQGLLDTYWSREVSEGFAHQFVGLVMLAPALFLVLLVGWLLENLFIEEAKPTVAKRVVANSRPMALTPPPRSRTMSTKGPTQ
jgi:exosortase